MKKHLFVVLALLTLSLGEINSQVNPYQTADAIPRVIPIRTPDNLHEKKFTSIIHPNELVYFAEYLPANYNPNRETKYKLIYYFHHAYQGSFSAPNGPTPNMLNNFIHYAAPDGTIHQGFWLPKWIYDNSFTSDSPFLTEEFILIAPQVNTTFYPIGHPPEIINEVIDMALNTYNVNPDNIYFYGGSWAGPQMMNYWVSNDCHASRVAGAFTFVALNHAFPGNYSSVCSTIVKNHLPIWTIYSHNDPLCNIHDVEAINYCTNPGANPKAIITYNLYDYNIDQQGKHALSHGSQVGLNSLSPAAIPQSNTVNAPQELMDIYTWFSKQSRSFTLNSGNYNNSTNTNSYYPNQFIERYNHVTLGGISFNGTVTAKKSIKVSEAKIEPGSRLSIDNYCNTHLSRVGNYEMKENLWGNFASHLLQSNPVSDRAILYLEGENSVISIYHLTGVLFKKVILQNGNNTVDISDLSEGIYLIHAEDGGKSKTEKMTVIK